MEFLLQNSLVILISVFFIITYLFSFFEKVVNWKPTVGYYKNHFKNTFVAHKISNWILLVLLAELIVIVFLIIGFFNFVINQSNYMLKYAFISSAITLLMLHIGQRIAKDYAGATTITVYFIVTILGIFFIK